MNVMTNKFVGLKCLTETKIQCKGPVKLMKRVKIAHSFFQSVSNLFHFIILSLLAYVVLHVAAKEFSKPTSENGEICRFNRSLLMESI